MGNPKIKDSRVEYPPAAPLPSSKSQRATRLASGHIVIEKRDRLMRMRPIQRIGLATYANTSHLAATGGGQDLRGRTVIGQCSSAGMRCQAPLAAGHDEGAHEGRVRDRLVHELGDCVCAAG